MPNSNRGPHTLHTVTTLGGTHGHTGHQGAVGNTDSTKARRQSLEIKLRYNNEEHKYEVVDSPCPTKYDTASQEYQMQLPSGKILVVKQTSSRRNSDTGSIANKFTGIEESEEEKGPPSPISPAISSPKQVIHSKPQKTYHSYTF